MTTPESDMERALELAHDVDREWREVNGSSDDGAPRVLLISRALIACREPVEATDCEEVMAKCGRCAHWIERGDRFCTHCGSRIKWTN